MLDTPYIEIIDADSLLLVLQASSFAVMIGLAMVYFFARYHQPDTSHEYEQMRWCNIASMLFLAAHYVLQIVFGFRAQGADVGALINTLFYPPAVFTFSYSFIRLSGRRKFRRVYLLVSTACVVLILGCFIGGYLYYGSLHMPAALYAMGGILAATILFCYFYPRKELRRMMQLVNMESGQLPVQYELFLKTSSTLLYASALLMSICIYYTPLVFLAGILTLVAIVFYAVSFIALGFNIRNVIQIVKEEDVKSGDTEQQSGKIVLSEEQHKIICGRLEEWKRTQGYAATSLSCSTLASLLHIPKSHLMQYLLDVEGRSFRVWLSDLRLEEAKRLIRKHPEYSNETIAQACGFSRSHLQVKFKETTGYTPNEWRMNCI